MGESTTELPVSMVVQHISPIITDEGVTAAVLIMMNTVEGTVRRFVMSVDDAVIFSELITDTLALKYP
jgi:hypothetical protein